MQTTTTLASLYQPNLTSYYLETIPALDKSPATFMDLKAYFTTHSNFLAIYDSNDPTGSSLYQAFDKVSVIDPSHTYHQSVMMNGTSYNSYCFDSTFKWTKVDVPNRYIYSIPDKKTVNGFTHYRPVQGYVQLVLSEGGFKDGVAPIRSNGHHLCGRGGYMQYVVHAIHGPFNPSSVEYMNKN